MRYTEKEFAKEVGAEVYTIHQLAINGDIVCEEIIQPGPTKTFIFTDRGVESFKRWKAFRGREGGHEDR